MCRSSTTSLASATIEKEVAPNSMDDSIHSTGTMNELLNPTLPTPDNSKYTMGNDTVLNLLALNRLHKCHSIYIIMYQWYLM